MDGVCAGAGQQSAVVPLKGRIQYIWSEDLLLDVV